jgi:ribose 5-phosphate isomerase B
VPLAQSVVAGKVNRSIAIYGRGVGASVCANKVKGVRAGLIHDHFSAERGVEDDRLTVRQSSVTYEYSGGITWTLQHRKNAF